MAVKRIEHVQSFVATDEDGVVYNLDVFVEIIATPTFADPDGETEGQRRIQTSRGHAVNYIEKGKYKTVPGVVLTSDDPKAP